MPITPLAITTSAWLWDKYGTAMTDRASDVLKSRWERFKWTNAAEEYRLKIKKLYGTMQIMGMSHPVPLDDIFTDAYLLDKPTAFRRFDIENLKNLPSHHDEPLRGERVNGLRVVTETGNLFILGKPGAGKTTFLKYIALKASEQTIDKIPIFVSLKEWADSNLELLSFIEKRFDICDFPDARMFVEEILMSSNAIVLFDGLDEVNQESGSRQKQINDISNFIEKYDGTQCLITCRIAASDYSFRPFTYVEIADFTDGQIRAFVRNWFRNIQGERDEAICQQFLTEVAKPDNKGLRELARTPLLLTLLCLAFSETLNFPRRRVEIYQEALDALLKKWDSSRGIRRDEIYRNLSLGHKENMLTRIAAETFGKAQYFIPQSELERQIVDFLKQVPPHDSTEANDGEAILKAIEAQHGIFVERARRLYSFSHLTLQEFLTAKYVAEHATKDEQINLVTKHCADDRWREVFLLATSLLPNAGQFMSCFSLGVAEIMKGSDQLSEILNWAYRKSSGRQQGQWQIREIYLRAEVGSLKFREYAQMDLAIVFDLNFIHAENNLYLAFNTAIRGSIELGLNDLKNALTELALTEMKGLQLDEEQAVTETGKFRSQLRAIMRKHRDIGYEWNLTSRQRHLLTGYLRAGRLFQDCLELAVMPLEEKVSLLKGLYSPL